MFNSTFEKFNNLPHLSRFFIQKTNFEGEIFFLGKKKIVVFLRKVFGLLFSFEI